jgi:hypothetical protein
MRGRAIGLMRVDALKKGFSWRTGCRLWVISGHFFSEACAMSALPPKADIDCVLWDGSKILFGELAKLVGNGPG